MTLWSCDLARAIDKLKLLYGHYHNANGHQTWQGSDVLWGGPTHKVTWLFGDAILRDLVTNWNHYNSTTRMPMTTKLCRMVTCHEGLSPIWSYDLLITWSCEVTRQIKNISLHYHNVYCHQTWLGGGKIFFLKITWSYNVT